MNFIFHNLWDVILPIDEVIFFKMVIAPPTRKTGFFPGLNPPQKNSSGVTDGTILVKPQVTVRVSKGAKQGASLKARQLNQFYRAMGSWEFKHRNPWIHGMELGESEAHL